MHPAAAQVLKRLVLPDGTILRAQLPGRPTRDCLFSDVLRDNTSLLKARRFAVSPNPPPQPAVLPTFTAPQRCWAPLLNTTRTAACFLRRPLRLQKTDTLVWVP